MLLYNVLKQYFLCITVLEGEGGGVIPRKNCFDVSKCSQTFKRNISNDRNCSKDLTWISAWTWTFCAFSEPSVDMSSVEALSSTSTVNIERLRIEALADLDFLKVFRSDFLNAFLRLTLPVESGRLLSIHENGVSCLRFVEKPGLGVSLKSPGLVEWRALKDESGEDLDGSVKGLGGDWREGSNWISGVDFSKLINCAWMEITGLTFVEQGIKFSSKFWIFQRKIKYFFIALAI